MISSARNCTDGTDDPIPSTARSHASSRTLSPPSTEPTSRPEISRSTFPLAPLCAGCGRLPAPTEKVIASRRPAYAVTGRCHLARTSTGVITASVARRGPADTMTSGAEGLLAPTLPFGHQLKQDPRPPAAAPSPREPVAAGPAAALSACTSPAATTDRKSGV